jgi:hypothetical protein
MCHLCTFWKINMRIQCTYPVPGHLVQQLLNSNDISTNTVRPSDKLTLNPPSQQDNQPLRGLGRSIAKSTAGLPH